MATAYPHSLWPHAVPWWRSLVFRVVLLCGVLLLCLLGSVLTITRYFFQEVEREMRFQTQRIAESISLSFEERSGMSLEQVETTLRERNDGFDIEVQPYTGGDEPVAFSFSTNPDGSITRIAQTAFALGDREMVLTAKVTVLPQTEILRAFTDRYVLVLLAAFVITLAAMVWFIRQSLAPLSTFARSCAAISEGNLEAVTTPNAAGEIEMLEGTFNRMVRALQEKETMEAKLRQAQRLSALGTLAAGVAHDVRNPLNAIKLLSSHAIDQINGRDDAATKPLRTIRKEVDRLEDIVSNFLSLAKETELVPEWTRVDPLIEQSVRLFERDAEMREVRLIHDLRAGDARLRIDRKQWSRAILNVLLNALEACPSGGRVRVFTRVSGATCQIEIRDDGPGMTRAERERIFDPYYTTKPGGTGLGLSITRGIIEEHGGSIEITSAPDKGCQVLIAMPVPADAPA